MIDKKAFAGLQDARRGFASNPLQQGRYLCAIENVTVVQEKDTQTNKAFVKVTLRVLQVEDGQHRPNEIVHTFIHKPVGHVGADDMYFSKIKTWLIELGADDSEETDWPEEFVKMCDDPDSGYQSPLAGEVVVVTAEPGRSTNKKGEEKTFTNYRYSNVLDETEVREALSDEEIERFFPNGL